MGGLNVRSRPEPRWIRKPAKGIILCAQSHSGIGQDEDSIYTHIRGPGVRPCGTLLLLLVPHAQDKQIFLLEIVTRDGIAIREHFSIVRKNEPPSGQRAARRRDDAVAQR